MTRFSFAVALLLLCGQTAWSQQPNVGTTVQLPTIRNFSVSTVVSVPDGGTMTIGGAGSGITFPGRRRGSRSSSRSVGRPGISISPRLLIGSEIDSELDRRGRFARSLKARPDIHGTKAEKVKASFLARNLGRGLR